MWGLDPDCIPSTAVVPMTQRGGGGGSSSQPYPAEGVGGGRGQFHATRGEGGVQNLELL